MSETRMQTRPVGARPPWDGEENERRGGLQRPAALNGFDIDAVLLVRMDSCHQLTLPRDWKAAACKRSKVKKTNALPWSRRTVEAPQTGEEAEVESPRRKEEKERTNGRATDSEGRGTTHTEGKGEGKGCADGEKKRRRKERGRRRQEERRQRRQTTSGGSQKPQNR
uniref:Uncharacterized protein n=1 Tax=Toxoplasma gondii COUG TaxID=1074873 RepID=A0A2G8XUJ2_TOXGO|nr:hypothetical protein TGCOUG_209780 [Toxoplasma gondii COUG]